MIEIIHQGTMTCIVDSGRYGHAAVGVPPSAALDSFAYGVLNRLLAQDGHAPALEVVGAQFSLRFHKDMICALTGARVRASLDDKPLNPWTSFPAAAGSVLKVHQVTEGFRYYLGFAGSMALPRVIGRYATNLECGFGGYRGRALSGGDHIDIGHIYDIPWGAIPGNTIPRMKSPHRLRVTSGPEYHYFSEASQKVFANRESRRVYDVSATINRTGIRLEGQPLAFRDDVDRSIISEGILPGTVQIPGDGLPIIMLYERTIGGYARIARVVRADLDRLAHLKPGDYVLFEIIGMEEAERLWEDRQKKLASVRQVVRRRS
jgi:antagonist of KipI